MDTSAIFFFALLRRPPAAHYAKEQGSHDTKFSTYTVNRSGMFHSLLNRKVAGSSTVLDRDMGCFLFLFALAFIAAHFAMAP